jgi:hypothetical protein
MIGNAVCTQNFPHSIRFDFLEGRREIQTYDP